MWEAPPWRCCETLGGHVHLSLAPPLVPLAEAGRALRTGVEGRVLPGLWSSLLCMKPQPLGEPPRPALGWRMSWRGKPKARPPRPKQRANTSAVLGAPLASRVRAQVVLCGVRLGGQ